MLSIRLDNNEVLTRTAGSGIAQGDPLSPILFNAVTAKNCKSINQAFISQYADNFVLYCTNKDISVATTSIQSALNTLSSLVDEVGLNISRRKTKVCMFRRGRSKHNVRIKLNSYLIEEVYTVKYLGMWLDTGLRWNTHINETRNKTLRFLNLFKVLAGAKWGVHPRHLRQLYSNNT